MTTTDMQAKFSNVSCSQCGRDFGPGNSGFSDCRSHAFRDWLYRAGCLLDEPTKDQCIDAQRRAFEAALASRPDAQADERGALMCERLRAMGLNPANEAADLIEQMGRAVASQPAFEAVQAVLREVDPKWRERGEFGVKPHEQAIAAIRDLAAAAPQAAPVNGIPATLRHDEGAIARCSYCGRYSIDPKTLSDRQPACECGERHGWSGSFEKPGRDAKWSGAVPITAPQAEAALKDELTSMTRMFHAACADLGAINETLGLDPEDGGAEPILDAIEELKTKAGVGAEAARQECPHGVDDGACKQCYGEAVRGEQGSTAAVRAIGAASVSTPITVLDDEVLQHARDMVKGHYPNHREYKVANALLAASAPMLGEQHTDEQAAFEAWWNANETWPVAAKNLALLAWTIRANKPQPQAAEPTDQHIKKLAATHLFEAGTHAVNYRTIIKFARALLANGE